MRQGEHYARLICIVQCAQEVCLARVCHYEETGVVMRIVLYVILQHLEPVHLCSVSMADGCNALQGFLCNLLG